MGSHSSKLQKAAEVNAAVGSLAGRRAVVFGGTNGIGEAMAKRLAVGGADVAIVGRSEEAGNKIVAAMRESNPKGTYAYIKADLMLMANGKAAVAELLNQSRRLDYVIFCQTKATTQGLTPTSEGIDEKLALNYYSRVYLTKLLDPALTATAALPNADVRVMSVLSGGVHGAYAGYETDPYLKESYSMKNAADAAGFYTDLWMDHAAQNNKAITYVHVAPGFVQTNWGADMNAVLRCSIRVMQASPLSKSAADCAEFLLQGLIAPSTKGGFRPLGEYGHDVSKTVAHTPAAVDIVHRNTEAVLGPLY